MTISVDLKNRFMQDPDFREEFARVNGDDGPFAALLHAARDAETDECGADAVRR